MILVTSPSKPVIYTAKNTLDRPGTLRAYEAEINGLYTAFEAARSPCSTSQETPNKRKGLIPPSYWGEVECLQFVRTAVETIIPFSLGDDDDFFQAGCDRLAVRFSLTPQFNPTFAVFRPFGCEISFSTPSVKHPTKFPQKTYLQISSTSIQPFEDLPHLSASP